MTSLGLVVQVLGFFDGTLDEYHLPLGDPDEIFKMGQKVKARVLYEVPGKSPPRFALSLAEHVVKLETKGANLGTKLQDVYPIGTVLDAVQVVKVETERGLVVSVQPNIRGFVHVSYTLHRLYCQSLKIPLDIARVGWPRSFALCFFGCVETG